MSLLGKGSAETKLGFLFDMYDSDKSGQLEKKEMEAIINQMKVVAKSLNRDENSANEFVKGLLAKIDKVRLLGMVYYFFFFIITFSFFVGWLWHN